jgi:colanic acid biosynthesis protein WcaH
VTDLSSFSSVAAAAQQADLLKKAPVSDASVVLDDGDFLNAIRLTPLVSIDLIVTDGNRRVLLGQRRNRPAQDSWFVPGGRVRKGETLDTAFTRVVRDELGIASVQRSACSSTTTTTTLQASRALARTMSRSLIRSCWAARCRSAASINIATTHG